MLFRSVVNLTQFSLGNAVNVFYAFFSMAMFAAMYYVLPRILGREWPSAILIKAHFWASALGVGILVAALFVFGWQEGAQMNNPEVDYMAIVKGAGFLNEVRVGAVALILCGQLVFLVNFGLMAASAALECARAFLKQIGLCPEGWRLP